MSTKASGLVNVSEDLQGLCEAAPRPPSRSGNDAVLSSELVVHERTDATQMSPKCEGPDLTFFVVLNLFLLLSCVSIDRWLAE